MAGPRLSAALLAAVIALPAPALAGSLNTITRFSGREDGGGPFATLKPLHGKLYGMAAQGGAHSAGTVFAADPTTGRITTLVDFTTFALGEAASPALTESGGLLYGTNYAGGQAGLGAVWSLDPVSLTYTTVYSFTGNNDGLGPQTGVVIRDGVLYGTTADGGGSRSHAGAVFAIDAMTGAETVLHSFGIRNNDGTLPNGLIWHDGALYGTTFQGGQSNGGTLFKLDPVTGKEQRLHDFGGAGDGYAPETSLIFDQGRFYGTTAFGGLHGSGTVFSFDPKTATGAIIHHFSGGHDGAYPLGGLLLLNGALYGTAATGGRGACSFLDTQGCGTIFKIDLATGKRQVLYAFSGGADGGTPYAGLAEQDHVLFGTTLVGGGAGCNGQGCGTVFRLNP